MIKFTKYELYMMTVTGLGVAIGFMWIVIMEQMFYPEEARGVWTLFAIVLMCMIAFVNRDDLVKAWVIWSYILWLILTISIILRGGY